MLKIAEYRKVLSEDGKSVRIEKIDLKELEKFGFRKVICGNGEEIFYKPKKGEKEVIEVEVDLKTREIKLSQLHDLFHTCEDTLYDLIEVGIVEKVADR